MIESQTYQGMISEANIDPRDMAQLDISHKLNTQCNSKHELLDPSKQILVIEDNIYHAYALMSIFDQYSL